MNLVELVFEEMAINEKREKANARRRATQSRRCRNCNHAEMTHVWDRDGTHCTKCECDGYWDGSE